MRLFIALPLPTEIEEFLTKIIFTLKQKPGKVKWVAPKNIHLTMKFLGETEESKVAGISDAIKKAVLDFTSFELEINKLGAFPNLRRPRVFWAGLEGNIDGLVSLAENIDSDLSRMGFERENRRFKPHLTLGRVKDDRNLDELSEYIKDLEFFPISLTLDRVVLFKSTLTPKGPIYDSLFESILTK